MSLQKPDLPYNLGALLPSGAPGRMNIVGLMLTRATTFPIVTGVAAACGPPTSP
jgi:hypothetical protein